MIEPSSKLIPYFAYGANRSRQMIGAIIGRKPNGFGAILRDYELYIQNWKEMPQKVRKILAKNWNSEFRTYFVRPRKGKVVYGKIWLLTEDERALVKDWEFWYTPIVVKERNKKGEIMEIETEMIKDYDVGVAVDGENYPIFLNNKKKMLAIAKRWREKPQFTSLDSS